MTVPNPSARRGLRPIARLDPWYLANLVCPVDKRPLRQDGSFLCSRAGRRYPIVEGVPVMLLEGAPETIGYAGKSLELAVAAANGEPVEDAPLYLSTIGVADHERATARQLHDEDVSYDPVAAVLVGATSGYAYRHLIGVAAEYPIPVLRFPTSQPGRLLDIGCNWGRWTIAASQAGHESVGIDPQLGAVLAAKRVAASLDTAARFVVADGRYLPFPDEAFDYVWSYSVLQHFAMRDVEATLDESRRVVRLSGLLRIQMANCLGIRSMMHLLKRRGKQPQNFDVRYWRPRRLKLLFEKHVGRTALTPDCYLGLGLQWSDFRRMTTIGKAALIGSEALRSASKVLPPLALLADSLFCTATPRSHEGAADLHDA